MGHCIGRSRRVSPRKEAAQNWWELNMRSQKPNTGVFAAVRGPREGQQLLTEDTPQRTVPERKKERMEGRCGSSCSRRKDSLCLQAAPSSKCPEYWDTNLKPLGDVSETRGDAEGPPSGPLCLLSRSLLRRSHEVSAGAGSPASFSESPNLSPRLHLASGSNTVSEPVHPHFRGPPPSAPTQLHLTDVRPL